MFQRFAFLSLALAVLASASPTLAQDDDVKERARTQFERGVAQVEEGNFEEALAAFQEAYRLKPHPNVRLNMANCYEELGRPVEALFHYERFLEEAEGAPPARKQEVRRALREVEKEIGKLQLEIAPDGARVTIDDAETRRAPIHEAIRLAAGEHTVEVRAEGYETQEKTVQVPGGETETVSIRLARPSTDAEPSVGAAEAEPTEAGDEQAAEGAEAAEGDAGGEGGAATAESGAALSSSDIDTADEGGGWRLRLTLPVWISAGATVAMAAVWLGTGVAALGAESDFDTAVTRSNDPSLSAAERQAYADRGRDDADKADRLARTSDVFMALTLAGAAATTFFVITEGMEEDPSERADAQEGRWTASPAVGRRGGGAVVRGTF